MSKQTPYKCCIVQRSEYFNGVIVSEKITHLLSNYAILPVALSRDELLLTKIDIFPIENSTNRSK